MNSHQVNLGSDSVTPESRAAAALTPFSIAWQRPWSDKLTDAEKRDLCTELIEFQRRAKDDGALSQHAAEITTQDWPDYLLPERMFG